jgi:hypothetical protein
MYKEVLNELIILIKLYELAYYRKMVILPNNTFPFQRYRL